MRDPTDALRAARAEEESGALPDKFRMLKEAKHARSRIVGAHLFQAHDSDQDGRLLDAADVHRRLEAHVYAGRVKQHDDAGLLETINLVTTTIDNQ